MFSRTSSPAEIWAWTHEPERRQGDAVSIDGVRHELYSSDQESDLLVPTDSPLYPALAGLVLTSTSLTPEQPQSWAARIGAELFELGKRVVSAHDEEQARSEANLSEHLLELLRIAVDMAAKSGALALELRRRRLALAVP